MQNGIGEKPSNADKSRQIATNRDESRQIATSGFRDVVTLHRDSKRKRAKQKNHKREPKRIKN